MESITLLVAIAVGFAAGVVFGIAYAAAQLTRP